MSQPAAESIDDLAECINEAEREIQRMHFNKNSPLDRAIIGFYASIIERAEAIHCLGKHCSIKNAQPILRSLLEDYVELNFLLKDPKHLLALEWENKKSWILYLEETKKGNPFGGKPLDLNLDETILKYKKEKKELEKQGAREIKIIEKFRMLGWLDIYEVVYRDLSANSHGSLRGINSRHIEVATDETDFDITLHAPPDKETEDAVFHTACTCVRSSTEAMRVSRFARA